MKTKIENILIDRIPGTKQDRLNLDYHEGIQFAGYPPANLYEVTYLEFSGYRHENGKKIAGFYSCQSEYFTAREEAIAAYRARLASSAPREATGRNTLEKILGRPKF